MNLLKVILWGKEIGCLIWNADTRMADFVYNCNYIDSVPDISPLLSPAKTRSMDIPVYGDERTLFQGLPPFIADSLPDSWGNTLMDLCFKTINVPRKKITPLQKLAFIGARGMGALEFQPPREGDFLSFREDCSPYSPLNLSSLYDLSLKISEGYDRTDFTEEEQKTLHTLLTIGTSAGGRQPKISVVLDESTGELFPGHWGIVNPKSNQDFGHYLLKFGSRSIPLAQIEYTYYRLALNAGVEMEQSYLKDEKGVKHFLTKRFDRRNGIKTHVQTLAAINPEADSYEDIFATGRKLNLSEAEMVQMFRRMVFNVLSNNTDDHNKNIAFLLGEDGKWHLAPAYDLTFIFNQTGNGPNLLHRMSVRGKRSGITREDLIDFAKDFNIPSAEAKIDLVAKSLSNFDWYASKSRMPQPWKGIIQKTINDNLREFGYSTEEQTQKVLMVDRYGRTISQPSIKINNKGLYELSANIGGFRERTFIYPNMSQYEQLKNLDIYNIPADIMLNLIETLMRPL